MMKKNNTKVVGITIDTKSKRTQDKVYYYRTRKDLHEGEVIRVGTPSGGSPHATVVDVNNQPKSTSKLKNLRVKK